jgi:hypothetical protein
VPLVTPAAALVFPAVRSMTLMLGVGGLAAAAAYAVGDGLSRLQ